MSPLKSSSPDTYARTSPSSPGAHTMCASASLDRTTTAPTVRPSRGASELPSQNSNRTGGGAAPSATVSSGLNTDATVVLVPIQLSCTVVSGQALPPRPSIVSSPGWHARVAAPWPVSHPTTHAPGMPSGHPHAYTRRRPYAGPMATHARAERAHLAQALTEAGPEAPTLCEGWTTRDLAAHVVVRERRVDAAAGIMIKALAPRLARVQAEFAARPWPELLDMVAAGPPRRSLFGLAPIDEAANVVEFFVHCEDVRRAKPGWEPRLLDRSWSRRCGSAPPAWRG